MSQQTKQKVVLLHGIGRTKFSMYFLAKHLKKANFDTFVLSYPSTKMNISECAEFIKQEIEKKETWKERPLSFVTHSMGGLVCIEYMKKNPDRNFHKAVFLGTPFQGAQSARIALRIPLLSLYFGPALRDIAHYNLPKELPTFSSCIICGSLGNSIGMNPLLKGDNDFLVRIEETHFPMVNQRRNVKIPHAILPFSYRIATLVKQFLNEPVEKL